MTFHHRRMRERVFVGSNHGVKQGRCTGKNPHPASREGSGLRRLVGKPRWHVSEPCVQGKKLLVLYNDY